MLPLPHNNPIPPDLIACHECDLLHRKRPLQAGETARCARCHGVLYRNRLHGTDCAPALACTALLLYVLTNAFPFIAIQAQGHEREITLLACVSELYRQHMPGLAALTFAILLLAPLLRISGLIYVLAPLRFHRRLPYWAQVWRVTEWVAPWSMMEIYLLGTLVALVKLAAMGTLILGIAFWAFMALVMVMTWAGTCVDREALWAGKD